MGRIMYTKKDERGELNYLSGVITFVREGADGKVLNIGMMLDGKDPASVSIACWNGEKTKLADRARAAKLAPGSFITVLVGELKDAGKNEKGMQRFNANAFRFWYNGAISIEDGDKTFTLVCGRAVSPREGDGLYSVQVPISVWNTEMGGQETDWVGVTFWNSEKVTDFADKAKERVTRGTAFAALCGAIKEREHNGRQYKSATAYRYVVAPPKKA